MLCSKLPPKTQWEKGRRKEYITSFGYVASVAVLKTLHEKTQWEKLIKGKRVQQLMLRSGLQDRLVIFSITIMSYGFRGWSPPEPCKSLSRLMPIPYMHL
jgi:hypothetical protein